MVGVIDCVLLAAKKQTYNAINYSYYIRIHVAMKFDATLTNYKWTTVDLTNLSMV